MSQVQAVAVRKAAHRGRSLLARELLLLVERHHHADGPGVTRETLRAYAAAVRDEMAGGDDVPFAPDEFMELIEERLTTDDDWTGDDFYRVGDGRVSVFPASWHDRLAGERDVRTYVEVLTSAGGSDATRPSMGGTGEGVPRNLLVDAMSVLGGVEPSATTDRIEELREEGVLAEHADQHHNPHVRLVDE
ncbi:hypothetical protein [Haloarchaeobius sp. TZWWS8]|uniref:hypothetical protein n=1 Tax=Haloarchaeobius sp. TZWWS8 TaxID=3446121 RepID=UPI003EBB848C